MLLRPEDVLLIRTRTSSEVGARSKSASVREQASETRNPVQRSSQTIIRSCSEHSIERRAASSSAGEEVVGTLLDRRCDYRPHRISDRRPGLIDEKPHAFEVVEEAAKRGDLATHGRPTQRAPLRLLECRFTLAKKEIDISGRERSESALADPVGEPTDDLQVLDLVPSARPCRRR